MKGKSYFLQILMFFSMMLLVNSCTNKNVSTINNSSGKDTEANKLNIENKELSLCEIGKNPADFDEKTVRLKVRIEFGIENAVVSDENCHIYDSVANFESKESYAPIDKARNNLGKKETFREADIEMEAKFINKPYTECCTESPFYFQITRIFDVKPIIVKYK